MRSRKGKTTVKRSPQVCELLEEGAGGDRGGNIATLGENLQLEL